MGKNLQNGDLVMRDEKVAFYEIPGQYAFVRMEGFTSLSTAKSATEHSRKYVDERSTRSDVVGYEESISYSFDRYDGNAMQDDIVSITDEEKVGKQATRRIIQVDMKTVSEDGKTATGRMRSYSVVPDSDGDDANVLTYSGTLKNNGEWEIVTVTAVDDDWQSVKLNSSVVKPKLSSLSVTSGGSEVKLTPTFSSAVTAYTVPSGTATAIVKAVAESSALTTVISCNGESYVVKSPSYATNQFNNLKSGDYITITVTDNGGINTTYKIKVS